MAKILVVDDSESVRTQLKKDLEAQGHTVVEGADGVYGLEEAQKHPDLKLIICDVNMPRMDGLTMAKKIHSLPACQSIPIFVMTTESTPDMKARGKEAGVLAWVTKPYVPEKLLGAIAKVLK